MLFSSSKKKVLVIDDDASLLRQVRARLEFHEAVNVIDAADGETGLKQAQNESPDLIILDWMLPGIQGTDVLEQLKRGTKTKDIPVIMLTGKSKIGDIEDIFTLGATAYLTKPVSLKSLGKKVSKILN